MRDGERGEVVNTSGCEPDTREFDSHRSPQKLLNILRKRRIFYFSLSLLKIKVDNSDLYDCCYRY